MSVRCPNASRTKHVHKGGGHVRCGGRLELVIQVPITVPAKGMPRGYGNDYERTVLYKYRRYGFRVTPRQLRESFKWQNVVCPECGWSLAAQVKALNKAAHKPRGRRRR